jgi:hypothetical protein
MNTCGRILCRFRFIYETFDGLTWWVNCPTDSFDNSSYFGREKGLLVETHNCALQFHKND